MKAAPIHMVYEAASSYNILALTSRCSTSCIFCSHHQNPKEVEAFFVHDLTLEEAVAAMEFLDKDKKIIIGESATRLCEGEPFIHKDFIKILSLLREKYKDTLLQITTSGVHLDYDILNKLKSIGNIELNISLNSCSQKGREKLYRGRSLMKAVEEVKNLATHGIAFSGSIVAMPHIVGMEDIEETIKFLSRWGAKAIRIFMPGYTKYSKIQKPPENIYEILKSLVEDMKTKVSTPLFLEPGMVKDLTATVEGVMAGSPAQNAGFKGGEIIEKVNGKQVFSRLDAYYKILSFENPIIEYSAEGENKKVVMQKKKEESSGLVFNYDIDEKTIKLIKRVSGKYHPGKCMVAASQFAYDMIKKCFQDDYEVDIQVIKNNYFGGNIGCSGLLVLEDVKEKIINEGLKYEGIILPAIMFDNRGRDLIGRHYKDLQEELGINIHIV